MRSSFAFLVTLALALSAGACFSKPNPECAFLCGSNDSCPDGYSCRTDGWCKRTDVADSYTCSASTPPADASVNIDGASNVDADTTPDANTTVDADTTPDAKATPDAMPPDATPPVDAIPPDAP